MIAFGGYDSRTISYQPLRDENSQLELEEELSQIVASLSLYRQKYCKTKSSQKFDIGLKRSQKYKKFEKDFNIIKPLGKYFLIDGARHGEYFAFRCDAHMCNWG